MRTPEGLVGIKEIKYFDRFRVRVNAPAKKRMLGGSVATHEARHAVAAVMNGTAVKKATIIPGPGYLGLTELSRPDPIAAAAPHATGSNGTDHDIAIVGFMGYDVSAAANAARKIIDQNHEEVAAVASLLEERQTVNGQEIQETIKNVAREREMARVTVEDTQEGKCYTEEVHLINGRVIFDKTWVKKVA